MPSPKWECFVVNIGGSFVRAAYFEHGADTPTCESRRESSKTPDDLIAVLEALRNSMLPGRHPSQVVLALPGPFDKDGNLTAAPTLFSSSDADWTGLARRLRSIWSRSTVRFVNDVSAYGRYVAGHGRRDFAVVNIGSGVGHKLYTEGRETVGVHGRGGELGHLVDRLIPPQLQCDCGHRQHVGAISSGRGFYRFVQWKYEGRVTPAEWEVLCDDAGQLSPTNVIEQWHNGNDLIRAAVSEAMRPLGSAIAGLHLGAGTEESLRLVGAQTRTKLRVRSWRVRSVHGCRMMSPLRPNMNSKSRDSGPWRTSILTPMIYR